MSSHVLELLNKVRVLIKYHMKPEKCITIENNIYSALDIYQELINIEAGESYPYGTEIFIEHDGFQGKVIGHYLTLEGKRGVVLQMNGNRIVHVYGEKWVNLIEPTNNDKPK